MTIYLNSLRMADPNRGDPSIWSRKLHSIAAPTAQHGAAFWQSEQERPPSRASGELTLGVLRDLDNQHVALGPVHDLRWDGAEFVTLYGAQSTVPDHDETLRV